MWGKPNETGSSKPSGMDMMIKSLLTAMGVTPDALTLYIEQGKKLATDFVEAMQRINKGMVILTLGHTRIENEQANQRKILEDILSEIRRPLAPGDIPRGVFVPEKPMIEITPETESEWIPQKQ